MYLTPRGPGKLSGRNQVQKKRLRNHQPSRLRFEHLESRTLLAADLVVTLSTDDTLVGTMVYLGLQFTPADGNQLEHFFGPVLQERIPVALDDARDGIYTVNGIEVIGQHGTQAALERDGQIVTFDSLASVNDPEGDPSGILHAVRITSDGKMLYVGASAGTVSSYQPSYWYEVDQPLGGIGSPGVEAAGAFYAVASTHEKVGATDTALYGAGSLLTWALPGDAAAAVDISPNGRYIVGDLIWSNDQLYGSAVIDTAGFDFSETSDVVAWKGVETDAQGAPYFAGEYWDADIEATRVGFWNGAGEFLGQYGSTFVDFAWVDETLIAAVNQADQGYIVRLSYEDQISVQELTGHTARFRPTGLFTKPGELGLLLEDASGVFVTTVAVFGASPPTIVVHWDMDGDGDVNLISNLSYAGAYVYEQTGHYTITATARDQYGYEHATATSSIRIRPLVAPTAELYAAPNPGLPGEEIVFEASFTAFGTTSLRNFFGARTVDRTTVLMDGPKDGIFIGDQIEILGSHQLKAVLQREGSLHYFTTMTPWTNPTQDSRGSIYTAAIQQDGSVLYVGESPGIDSVFGINSVPTYWFDPASPQAPHFEGELTSGHINAVSENGIFVGHKNRWKAGYWDWPPAMWGKPGDFHWYRLPEMPGTRPLVAYDISRNSEFIVGLPNHVWQRDEAGYYNPLPLNFFELNDHVVSYPEWRGVEGDDQGNVYFAGEYFDLNEFVTRVGFWNQEGKYIGTVGGSAAFRDFAVVSGEVIALVDGFNDAYLVRMSDGATISMKQLTGSTAHSPYNSRQVRGLFEGENELGMLLAQGEDNFYTVFETMPDESPFYAMHFDFDGDGVIDLVVPSTGKASVTYQYDQPGVYQATVSVRDSEGEEIAHGAVEVVISSEWRVDVTLSPTSSHHTPGSIAPVDNDRPVNIFHEWQYVSVEIWVTLVEELPTEPSDFQFAIDINPGLYTAFEWISHMGTSAGAAMSLEGERPRILATLTGVDLTEYALGDRILVGTLLLAPDTSSPVGVPVEGELGYAQPFDHADLQLSNATVDGGTTLAFTSEIEGLWVPMPYDLDDDGRVGLSDFTKFIAAYGQYASSSPAVRAADFDRNGRVGLSDFVLFISHYGRVKGQDGPVQLPKYVTFNQFTQRTTSTGTVDSPGEETLAASLLEGEPLLPNPTFTLPPTVTRPAEQQAEESPLAEPTSVSPLSLISVDPRLLDQVWQGFESPADFAEWEDSLDVPLEIDWYPIGDPIDPS